MANVAPNAPSLSAPIGSVTLDYANVQRFSWIFSDPDSGDSQSKYDLQYRIIGDTSWTTVTETTPNNFYDFPAATFGAHDYEWQVRTYDAGGLAGPFSASSFFTAATAPTSLTITAPISNATVNALPTFTWSTPDQDSYQIRRVRDSGGVVDAGTVYYDSGEVVDAVTRSVSVSMPTNNRYEWIQVRVKDSGLWSAYVSVRVLASYTLPSPGSISIVADDDTGSLIITATASAVGGGEPTPIYVDLYVREEGSIDVGTRIASHVYPNGTFTWRTPASGVNYEVRSLTTADNGAQRWSRVVYAHIIDGGGVATPDWVLLLDDASPSTTFTNVVDGGTP